MPFKLSKLFCFILIALGIGCESILKKSEKTEELSQPKITRPEVRKVWVPDQIHDNVYEMGHWQYVIDKQSVWSKRD